MAADAISLLRMLATEEQLDDDQQKAIADALVALLEDGLNGNRAVAGTIADVVAAAVRAYPLQLSPSAERAAAVAKATSPGGNLSAIWALQATADGALGPFLAALCAQPQIATAWLRGSPLRDAAVVAELREVAGLLKGRFLSPFDRLQAEGLVASPSGRRTSATGEQAAPASIQTEEDALRPSRSSRRLRGQRSGGPGSSSSGPGQPQQQGDGGGGGGRALKRSGSSGGGSGSGLLLSRRARERARAAAGGSGRRGSAEGQDAQPLGPRVTVQLVVATGEGTTDTDQQKPPLVRVAISIQDPAAAAAAAPPPRIRKRDRFAAAANAAAASAAAAVGDALALPGNLARAALSAVAGAGVHEHGATAAAAAATTAAAAAAGEGADPHQEAPAGPLPEGAESGDVQPSAAAAAAGGPAGPLEVLRGIKRTAVARGQHIGEAVGGALAHQLAAVKQGRGDSKGKACSGGGAAADGGSSIGGAEGSGAEAASDKLRASAPALAARAAAAARQVAAEAAAAAHSRDGGADGAASQEGGDAGGIDDSCVVLGPLLGALAEVLAHGLRTAPVGRRGGRRGGGGGATPFAMLLALDARGGRRSNAKQTGARAVARARPARRAGTDDNARLDQWLRASLNARALGARLSSLCAQPAALAAWYEPSALVLQAATAILAEASNGNGQPPSGEQQQQQQQQQQQEGSLNGDGGQGLSAAKAGDLEVWELLRAVEALDALHFSLAPVAPPPPPPAAEPPGSADGPPAGRGASWLAGLRWRGASSSSAGGAPAPLRPIRPRRGPSGRSQGGGEEGEEGEGHSSDSELSPLAAEEAVSPTWWTGGGLASFQALMRSGSSGRDRGGGGAGAPAGGG